MKTIRMCVRAGMAGLVVAGVTACGSGGTEGTSPEKRPDWMDFTNPAFPGAPTPAPLGPVYLDELSTPDGTARISAGACLGFTLVANEEGLTFGPETKVTVGPLGVMEKVMLDGTRLRVGDASNGHVCRWTPIFGESGTWDVTVEQDGFTHVIEDAIKVDPTRILDVGIVSADAQVWSLDRVLDGGANAFEVPYDIDVYRVNFWSMSTSTVYTHSQFFPTGPAVVVPVMEFRESAHPEILTARGGHGLIFPKRGTNYIVVKDAYGDGGPGATYDVSFSVSVGNGLGANQSCATAPLVSAGTHKIDYDSLTNKFNPEEHVGCRDSIYLNGIDAPGGDAVWRVRVPAGKQLRVSTYDDHIDNVTYLLPVDSGCPARPTNCVRASGRFGGGNTDALIYDNVSGMDEEFLLVHDSAVVRTDGVGQFLMDVKMFDKY